MRKFEKISYEQFTKDIKKNKKLYTEYKLPKRSTKTSAGYDFFAIEDFTIKPNEQLISNNAIDDKEIEEVKIKKKKTKEEKKKEKKEKKKKKREEI